MSSNEPRRLCRFLSPSRPFRQRPPWTAACRQEDATSVGPSPSFNHKRALLLGKVFFRSARLFKRERCSSAKFSFEWRVSPRRVSTLIETGARGPPTKARDEEKKDLLRSASGRGSSDPFCWAFATRISSYIVICVDISSLYRRISTYIVILFWLRRFTPNSSVAPLGNEIKRHWG